MSTNRRGALYFEVTSHREVRDLASQILSRDRDYPVIALTAAAGEHEPPLSVKRIMEIVGPDTPVYFLASVPLSLHLSHLLPHRLSVGGGAGRLWWPGVDEDSRAEDHPKFYGLTADSRDLVYEWLEGEFCPPTGPTSTLAEPPPHVHSDGPSCERSSSGQQGGASIVTGVKVLAEFASGQPIGNCELAARLSLSRSAAQRCLVELTWLGYLVETRERRFTLAGGSRRAELLEIATN